MDILIVDDDTRLRQLLEQYLTQEGFTVFSAADVTEARALLTQHTPNVAVVDWMMPGENGIEFLNSLRAEKNALPVILLTARAEAEDRITGLESGANDYLPKPFEPRELVLRIKNLHTIYSTTKPSDSIHFGNYHYQPSSGSLMQDGDAIYLTSTEQTILHTLAQQLNQPVSREELSAKLNGISERSIDVQITRLRRKLEENPKQPTFIQTVRGKGYRLHTS